MGWKRIVWPWGEIQRLEERIWWRDNQIDYLNDALKEQQKLIPARDSKGRFKSTKV